MAGLCAHLFLLTSGGEALEEREKSLGLGGGGGGGERAGHFEALSSVCLLQCL